MHLERVADIFIEIAGLLFLYGSNAGEIENTITKLGNSYGLEIQIASIGTVIYLTVIDAKGKSITRIKRVTVNEINFYKLEKLENLLEKFISERTPLLIVKKELIDLNKKYMGKTVPFFITIIAVFVACFSFSVVFKGNFTDAFISSVVGTFVYLSTLKISNRIFKDFIAGFFIHTFLEVFSIFMKLNFLPALAGSIMIFVPGLLLTNSVIEIGERNFVSGSSKLLESLIILSALVLGAGISSALWR
ncbi:MAG: threonine/serine exporter family protein [Thermotogae bacterium]|nr:threonine/serine exporter family protein [Thermotogota bacterium]MCP5465151.1 threonine/serine exporter family protein [Thermotogota bacterium]HOO74020.1 threonine/serine exporter family protein [Tepiditoga sp.]